MRMEKGSNNILSTQNSQKKLGDCYLFKCLLRLMLKKCKIIVEFEVELILLSFFKDFQPPTRLSGQSGKVLEKQTRKISQSLQV